MNAAFVILASALLGNHPAAASCNTPACASAPVASAPTCDTCSGHSFGHGLRSKLSGMFACHSCNAPAPCAAPCAAPAPVPCAAPTPACDACGSVGHGHGHRNGMLLGKLRGMFSHSCNSCAAPAAVATCDSCGSSAPATSVPATAAPAVVPANPEPVGAPKKMPDAPKGDAPKIAPKGDKAVRYEETPEAPLSIPTSANPVVNNRPAVIIAPATLRNPF